MDTAEHLGLAWPHDVARDGAGTVLPARQGVRQPVCQELLEVLRFQPWKAGQVRFPAVKITFLSCQLCHLLLHLKPENRWPGLFVFQSLAHISPTGEGPQIFSITAPDGG